MSYLPLGQKILQLRSQLGLTQKELAKRMRTSQQAISRLERGEYVGYTLRTLEKLARATGTELVVDFRAEENSRPAGTRRPPEAPPKADPPLAEDAPLAQRRVGGCPGWRRS